MYDAIGLTTLGAEGLEGLPLIRTIAAAFAAAWVLGIITQKLRLSPIVGYLLAGVLISPHTPGFVGDTVLAHQLAEVGVILLMFGVGLHFHLKDLNAVKWIAIPGALGQSLIATVAGMVLFHWLGWDWKAGLVIGMAMAVASTVVLIRVLTDNDALTTPAGHAAVGWLIVEDIFTVVFLVVLPVLGRSDDVPKPGEQIPEFWPTFGWAMLKLAAFVAIVFLIGSRIVPWILVQVTRLRSRELFTLTILVLSIAVAAGAYYLFGASMALGAFLAGMMVAQSPVSHQAAADALPLRDAFAVLFFVSVGMLFDWHILIHQPVMLLAGLAIVLVAKPLAALAIVMLLRHSMRTALTVAVGLAQIGEFSFILSQVAFKNDLMPPAGNDVIVGTAILSITLNPLLFRLVKPAEQWLRSKPVLWRLLNTRAEGRLQVENAEAVEALRAATEAEKERTAIVVGYGHVGRTVDRLLQQAGVKTVIIDMNMDTVAALNTAGRAAIYGDGSNGEVLRQAGAVHAKYLLVTMAGTSNPAPVVVQARGMNPDMHILVRTRYLRERSGLTVAGATATVFEEAEAAIALGELVLKDLGADDATIGKEIALLRTSVASGVIG
ncbi:MAG: cation:proton antiporter [Phycisphaeraceae bacterium]|nr:cation:proton antiporter [Phycisphaeraceae bacterium]